MVYSQRVNSCVQGSRVIGLVVYLTMYNLNARASIANVGLGDVNTA